LFEFVGDIIKKLKENGYEYTWGNVTVKLAEAYGFCWGVERAVQIAYEARKQFPDDKIWITNEIIHNPTVNKVLLIFFFFFSIWRIGVDRAELWQWEAIYDKNFFVVIRYLRNKLFLVSDGTVFYCCCSG
jgi:hypothetical protein